MGLIGAAVGALISGIATWVATHRQIAAERTLRQAERLADASADLWSACDLQWEAAQEVGWAVYEIHCEREAGRPIGSEYWARRANALRARSSAEGQARSALGRLKLGRAPQDLLTAADNLVKSSAQYKVDDDGSSLQDVARAESLSAFEAEVDSAQRAISR